MVPTVIMVIKNSKNQDRRNKMDQKLVLKQMIDFNKAAYNNTFNAFVILQDQAESLSNTL